MVIIINDEIDHETLAKLADAYNQINDKQIPILQIFFTSGGGESHAAEAIIELINRFADRTILTIHSFIESAAFDIFFSVKCTRIVLDTAIGTAHVSRWPITVMDGGGLLDDREQFKMKYMKGQMTERLNFYASLGMTEQELEVIKSGKDLYLNGKRMQKLLKNQEKNEIYRKNP